MASPTTRRIAIIGWPLNGKTRYLVSLNRLGGVEIGNWKVSLLTQRFTQFVSYWKDRVEATHRHEQRWLELDLFTVQHQQTGQSITFTAWDISGEVFHACFDSESEAGRSYLSTEEGKQLAAQFLAQLKGLAGLVFVFSEHVEQNPTRAFEHYSLVFNGLKHQAGGLNYPVVMALTCSDLLPQQGTGDEWERLLEAVEEHRTGKRSSEQLLDRANELGRMILRLPQVRHLELERQLNACTEKWCALPLSSVGDPEAIQQDAKGQKFIDLKRVRPVGVEWPFQWLLERFEEREREARQAQVEFERKLREAEEERWRKWKRIITETVTAVGLIALTGLAAYWLFRERPSITPPPSSQENAATPAGQTREQRLKSLLQLYLTDRITPRQYHEQRAKILSGSDTSD